MTSTSRVGFLFSSFSREEQGLISRGTRSEEGNAARPRNGSLLFNCSPGLPAVLPRKSRLSPSHCLSLSHQMRRLPAYQLHRPAASSLGPSSSSAAFSLFEQLPQRFQAPFSSVIKTLLSPPCDWLYFNVLSHWLNRVLESMLRSKILQRINFTVLQQ